MEAATRRTLRWAAYAVFLVVAPLLLAYAAGYRLGPLGVWSAGPPAPSVGALVVRTVPRSAGVSLDGTVLASRTPTAVGSIPEGLHVVRIEKAGYRPYEKHLTVRGGTVTDLLAVRLLPERAEEIRRLGGITDAWPSPDGRRLFVRGGGAALLVTTAELERATVDEGLPAAAPSIRVRDDLLGRVDALWAPSGDALALVQAPDAPAPPTVRAVLTADGRMHSLPPDQTFVGWLHGGQDVLVTITSSKDLVTTTVPREGRAALRRSALVSGVTAAAIHPQGILAVRPLAAEARLALVAAGGATTPLFPSLPAEIADLGVSRRGHVAARTSVGLLDVLRAGADHWERVAEGVTRAEWSPDGNKLLFQESPYDLWVVNVSEERSPVPLGHPELLLRLSSPLGTPRWFSDSQRVFVWQQDILSLVEIDPRGGHRIDQLLSANRGPATVGVTGGGDILWVPVRRDGADMLVQVFLRLAADR